MRVYGLSKKFPFAPPYDIKGWDIAGNPQGTLRQRTKLGDGYVEFWSLVHEHAPRNRGLLLSYAAGADEADAYWYAGAHTEEPDPDTIVAETKIRRKS